jgi:outer membrane murein-binding lipoprotein Lpp
VIEVMRRILIAAIAGGFLLLSGIAASAKLDTATAEGQDGQQQTQQDRTPAAAPATKPATPATPATKPAAPAPKPASTTAECGEQGDNTGDHQNDDGAACNDEHEQAGANEKTNANDGANKED